MSKIKYYRHFELTKFCDWTDWRDTGGFQFDALRLVLRCSYDEDDGLSAIICGSLLGLGFTLEIGRWVDHEREQSAAARARAKAALGRRLRDSS